MAKKFKVSVIYETEFSIEDWMLEQWAKDGMDKNTIMWDIAEDVIEDHAHSHEYMERNWGKGYRDGIKCYNSFPQRNRIEIIEVDKLKAEESDEV